MAAVDKALLPCLAAGEMSLNTVVLIGTLREPPRMKFSDSAEPMAALRLGTVHRWRDKSSGEMRTVNLDHRLACYGRLAESVAALVEGQTLFCEGSLRYPGGRAEVRVARLDVLSAAAAALGVPEDELEGAPS